jgi:uncharacterized protein YegP (UPF0339 family)
VAFAGQNFYKEETAAYAADEEQVVLEAARGAMLLWAELYAAEENASHATCQAI